MFPASDMVKGTTPEEHRMYLNEFIERDPGMRYTLANTHFVKHSKSKIARIELYMLFLDKEKTSSIAFLEKKCTKSTDLRYTRVEESKMKDKRNQAAQ